MFFFLVVCSLAVIVFVDFAVFNLRFRFGRKETEKEFTSLQERRCVVFCRPCRSFSISYDAETALDS